MGTAGTEASSRPLHYGRSASDADHKQRRLIGEVQPDNGTYTTWHRLSVDFSPHRLDYFLDGTHLVSAVTASSAGVEESADCPELIKEGKLPGNICYVADDAIPDALTYNGADLGARRFIFQTETVTQATPDTFAPTAYIDWVAIYRLNE